MSKTEEQDFRRFGCTLKERTGTLHIDWRGMTDEQASNAQIFATLVSVETETATLILLALQVSPVRPLPRYCYFPFDITKHGHTDFLSNIFKAGDIPLSFATDGGVVRRTHHLTADRRLRAAELYTQALNSSDSETYEFEAAVRVVERWIRVPDFLDQGLSADDTSEILERIKQKVQLVPAERREFARRIIQQAVEAFKPYYERNRKSILESVQSVRRGCTYIADLEHLSDNPSAWSATELFGDGIAASFSQADLDNLNEYIQLAISLPKLFSQFTSTPEPQPSTTVHGLPIPPFPMGLRDILKYIRMGRGISQESLRQLAEVLGIQVGGKQGRPPKDYSREYELKMSGLSWSEVTRQVLAETPELQDEFGSADFESLDYGARERLQNRIRQGVRAHAQRTGKPLPSDFVM